MAAVQASCMGACVYQNVSSDRAEYDVDMNTLGSRPNVVAVCKVVGMIGLHSKVTVGQGGQ